MVRCYMWNIDYCESYIAWHRKARNARKSGFWKERKSFLLKRNFISYFLAEKIYDTSPSSMYGHQGEILPLQYLWTTKFQIFPKMILKSNFSKFKKEWLLTPTWPLRMNPETQRYFGWFLKKSEINLIQGFLLN